MRKALSGRTYILDELSFSEEHNSQFNLFTDVKKELEVGYQKRFTEFRDKINTDLANEVGATPENREYSYLTTYLRQAVIRYGSNSQLYLGRAGIQINEEQLQLILSSLNSLSISKEICLKNRYWDPIDLNNLSKISHKFLLPTSASEQYISYQLKAILIQFQTAYPTYYNHYFGVYNQITKDGREKDLLLQSCILAENWLKEKTLYEMLQNSYYDTSDKIDETISFIQNKISYGLPLLLKPLYDLKEPNGMFTRFIEMGAYKPITRKLIELNVPRETAIFLSKNFVFEDYDDREKLIREVRQVRNSLSYWHRIQLTSI